MRSDATCEQTSPSAVRTQALKPLRAHGRCGLDPPPSLTCDRTLLSAAMTVGMPSFVEQPAAGQGITWRDLGHLTGVFPFKHLTASEDQQRPSWLLTQLQCFIAALQEQAPVAALWPDLSPSQLSHLQTTLQLVHDPGQGLHVEWLQEFGCALLPLPPSALAAALHPDHAALYLMAPDGWTFDTHSYPDVMQFTSSDSKASCLYVGSVAAAQYSSLIGTMNTIIQEQQALKAKDKSGSKGQRQSHLQRTPAFVVSVITAALELLPADLETGASAGDALMSRGLLQQGSDTVISITPPRGGFTDVGKHTGSSPKATSWPVLRAVFQVLLQLRAPRSTPRDSRAAPELQHLFDQTMMHFELWLTQQLVQQLTPATAVPAAVTACMTMLQSVAGKAAELAVSGLMLPHLGVDFTVAAVQAACLVMIQQVHTAVGQRQLLAAAEYALPLNATAAAGSWHLPSGKLPVGQPAMQQQQGLVAARTRAGANLRSLPFVTNSLSMMPKLARLKGMLSKASAAVAATGSLQGGSVEAQHSLRSLERLMFKRAAAVFDQPALTADEVAALASTVDAYRVTLAAFKTSLAAFRSSSQHGGGDGAAGSMAAAAKVAITVAELRSREVLVGWAAFCLTHQAAAAAHDLVLGFGVAVDWHDLRHLTLTDKAAKDAVRGVCTYLKQHSRPGLELFHLSKPVPSLSFAETYAAKDPAMQTMLRVHETAAAARMSQHWQKVQEQQQQAAGLRTQIGNLQNDRRAAEQRLRSMSKRSHSYYDTMDEINNLKSSIGSKQSALAAAEKPPPPVIQPLPRQPRFARQWLFFLHMPDLLRHLARSSCLAQQLLLPRPLPSNSDWPGHVEGLVASLPDFYNINQADQTYHTPCTQYSGSNGGPGNVLSMSNSSQPKQVGPTHIDSYYSREDGVWFPDSMALTMAWAGSSCTADVSTGAFFNPFLPVSNTLTVQSFTAQMPGSYSGLQWALYQYGSLGEIAADRGNQGLASQDKKPADLSKPAYLAATALRSFPARQLHKLCDYLRDKELPLENPAVQLLVEQTVYHLGQLVESDSSSAASAGSSENSNSRYQVAQLWRTGWSDPGGVLDALCFELQQLASELANKPRDQGSVLLLGQLAAYLSDWHPACKPVVQQFAAMTSRYADQQLQQQIDVLVSQAPDEAALAELKAKQTRWRAMSLLCFAAGPLDSADVGSMLRLMLLIKHGDVYQPDRSTAAELSALRVRCDDVMARRLPQTFRVLLQQPQLLTDAAASILECLQQQPDGTPPPQLTWKQLVCPGSGSGSDSGAVPVASFEAVGSDGHLYSINVLDGTLLFDGNPPGRLPNSILQHSLYLRTFGATNHEVRTTADGQLETIRPIEGRFYRFNPVQATPQDQDQLVVTEIDPTQQDVGRLELQLLDPGADDGCDGWGDELPVRCRQIHSHWFDRQHGVIVLRPKDFHKHAPQFLICCNVAASMDCSAHSSSAGNAGDAVSAVYSCWPVPLHLQQCHWTAVLTLHAKELSQHQLVLPAAHSSQVLKVFSKFEAPEFIHVFTPGHCPGLQSGDASSTQPASVASSSAPLLPTTGEGSAGMVWQLARCSLEFELTADGRVMSLDHRGYSLSTQQLLVSQSDQGVTYTLPELHQYLVLQSHTGSTSKHVSADHSDRLVLVPAGQVSVQRCAPGSMQAGSNIQVQLEPHCFASVKVFKYSVHGRFGYLTAPCTTSRLQLAALYAASSTLLPEPSSQLTGAATAMQLVRYSWTNEPLSSEQHRHLQDISTLGGFLAPALKLLCHDVAASSSQLQHLHIPETGSGAAARLAGTETPSTLTASSPKPVLDPDAVTEYLRHVRSQGPAGFPASPRLQLNPEEEEWLLHMGTLPISGLAHSTPAWKRFGAYAEISALPELPVAAEYVEQAEAALAALVEQPQMPTQLSEFPLLPLLDSSVPVAQHMMDELRDSWECYQQHPAPEKLVPGALEKLSTGPYTLAAVRHHRKAAESHLLHHLAFINPDVVGDPGRAFRLLVDSGVHPSPSPTDLLSLAWGPESGFRSFNPFLSDKACAQLRAGVLVWLQLCVLEDRLERIMSLAGTGDEYMPLLIRELLTRRTWDVARHAQWLVFEVEGRLQIRPAQHTLARTLLDGSLPDGLAPIAQLNMGEGKTRVILPMMALELADGGHLVRVIFLSQLLHDGKAHLQQHLTASVLGRKVFVVPFHRGIQVTPQALGAMKASLIYCQKVGGVLLMAPEHKNSLYLKYLELANAAGKRGDSCSDAQQSLAAQTASTVLDLLNDFPYFDILDESDEVLHHHRRQLVYAWGGCIPLPALEARVQVVQSLLLLLSKLTDAGAPELNLEGLALKTGPASDRKPGSFCGLQLLSGEQLDASVDTILKLLATTLAKDPPMQDELGWMRSFQDKGRLNLLVELMTDRSKDAAASDVLSTLPDDKQHQLLAARGLLACGVLVHCLQSRHRVNHGVNRSSSAKKQLSVPFLAADLPSPRSEFSQPDVAMTYTHLSYYIDGLSKAQLRQAVLMLLGRGPSAQAYHFNRWLAQGCAFGSQDTGDCTSTFDAVDKVDPHNTQLMDAMWAYFSHNMEVVNFWLASCVLPTETKQYPSRLTATAWHLAERSSKGRGLAGFSGTNDNHRLLPSQVQQVPMRDAPELLGPNGKMLDMLLRHACYDTLLPCDDAQVDSPVWQQLLEQALEHDVDAVIDAGALLAGVDLRLAAEHIMDNMRPGRYQGVTYFCPAAGCWVILDPVGRLAPRRSSHLVEAETLALFDDARCRGADLVLRQCAVGLLTLSAGMPKDKLMQAAGRLRQLGRGQTLLLMGLPDISSKIAAAVDRPSFGKSAAPTAGAPDMRAVLSWVMANTVEATLSGIAEAAHQGMQFAATYRGAPQGCVLPERLSVDDLYGGRKVQEPLPQLLHAVAEHYAAHSARHVAVTDSSSSSTSNGSSIDYSSSCSSSSSHTSITAVLDRFSGLGRGHTVLAGQGTDEECERELEQEEEEETEREVQVPAATAAAETSWNWHSAFTASSSRTLQQAGCQMVQLPQGVQQVGGEGGVGEITWCGKVWVSHNYLHSISGSPVSPGLRDYLRPVGALLVFPASREVLLLSEREADAVQSEVWATVAGTAASKLPATAGTMPNLLLSLPYLRLGCAEATTVSSLRSVAATAEPAGPDPQYDIAQLQQQAFLVTALAAPSRGGAVAVPRPDQLAALVPAELLVSVQLFAGAVMYGSAVQRELLHGLVSGKREAAQELLAWRGRLHLLARSDLDRACNQQLC